MTRKRWMNRNQLQDWLFEVVELFFSSRGWDIEPVYLKTYSLLTNK
ncbi:hypothetical protein FHW17_004994 [Phyllobacterium sp. P30BS-XVII]|nr:hypothetical protein [Phyllobacterium sp. P30BS-XVII]